MTVPAPDHDTLVERACAGDDDALAALVTIYHDRVYRYGKAVCRSTDLDDAVQDAFVALARSRHTFRGESRIGTWLFTTVRNACLQMLRPRARRQRAWGEQSDVGALDAVATIDPGPEELAVRRELIERVHDALADLQPDHREILVLRDLEGRSGAETAAALGLTEVAMKSRLHRARRALRARIESGG